MKIVKKLNNNVVIAVNKLNKEFVLIGKGIAFHKSLNDEIDRACADKVFFTKGKGVAEKLGSIIEDIPIDYVKVSDEIINLAKNELKEELNEKIYLTLIDHLSFAIERHKAGVDISSLLKWEIKKIAPDEYRVGQMALDVIEKRLAIRLPDDEAAYVAFHIINSRIREDDFTEKSIELTRQILEVIKEEYAINYDEDNLPYNRFIIHLQYLARRIFKQEEVLKTGTTFSIYSSLKDDLPEGHQCVDRIAHKIKQEHNFELSDDERAFLLIHLYYLISENNTK